MLSKCISKKNAIGESDDWSLFWSLVTDKAIQFDFTSAPIECLSNQLSEPYDWLINELRERAQLDTSSTPHAADSAGTEAPKATLWKGLDLYTFNRRPFKILFNTPRHSSGEGGKKRELIIEPLINIQHYSYIIQPHLASWTAVPFVLARTEFLLRVSFSEEELFQTTSSELETADASTSTPS